MPFFVFYRESCQFFAQHNNQSVMFPAAKSNTRDYNLSKNKSWQQVIKSISNDVQYSNTMQTPPAGIKESGVN